MNTIATTKSIMRSGEPALAARREAAETAAAAMAMAGRTQRGDGGEPHGQTDGRTDGDGRRLTWEAAGERKGAFSQTGRGLESGGRHLRRRGRRRTAIVYSGRGWWLACRHRTSFTICMSQELTLCNYYFSHAMILEQKHNFSLINYIPCKYL